MNNHDAPPLSTEEPAAHELPAIEFESPGRFAVHNPASPSAILEQREPSLVRPELRRRTW